MKNHWKNILLSVFLASSLLMACIPDPKPVENLPEIEQALILSNASFDNENFNLPINAQTFFITKSFNLFGFTPTTGTTYSTDDIAKLAYSNLDVQLTSLKTQEKRQMSLNGTYGVYVYVDNDNFFVDNTEYQINIKDENNNKQFSAKTTYLPSVSFSKLCISTKPQGKPDEYFIEVHFEFKDFDNQKDYYLVSARKISTDINLVDEFTAAQGDFLPVDDSEEYLFDGYIKSSYLIAIPRLDFFAGDNILIGLSHISKDYYDYLTEYKKRAKAFGFVTEPYNIKSNLTNGGLGYFSLHRTTLRTSTVVVNNVCN